MKKYNNMQQDQKIDRHWLIEELTENQEVIIVF